VAGNHVAGCQLYAAVVALHDGKNSPPRTLIPGPICRGLCSSAGRPPAHHPDQPDNARQRPTLEEAGRLNLYAWSDEDLEALIVKHADPVITTTARYIVDLRRGLAAGKTC
jgi:hypothetical protein